MTDQLAGYDKSMNCSGESSWGLRLMRLGLHIQHHLRNSVGQHSDGLAKPVKHHAGDTIYELDRRVEHILIEQISSWAEDCKPLLLIAEGTGDEGVTLFGSNDEPMKYRLIVDPIDGTRSLMYDKRSGWFLAAVAKDRGEETSIADTFAATIVELPVSKQGRADLFVSVRGQATFGRRVLIGEETGEDIICQPSAATSLKDGFAHVSSFFPGTKVLAAELMERIALATVGSVRAGAADIFDDQYICTGGQMVELMVGHDRFCCDLRPLFYDILESAGVPTIRGIECHPYDIAGSLVAMGAGVILTDGFGHPLNSRLNVHQGVHWCGYANDTIRRSIEPVVKGWLAERGVKPK